MLTRTALLIALLWLSALALPAGEVLYVYTWADYFNSEVIGEFEKKYDCRVDLTFFGSNEEMYRALKFGDASFDIVTPSSYMSSALWEEGELAAIDHDKIPNLKNLGPGARHLTDDPDLRFSVPFTVTICGVGYHRDVIAPEDVGGWDIFANPRYRGRMVVIDAMRETIGAALRRLGYSVNTTDDRELAEAAAVLRIWKANLSAVIDDSHREVVNTDDRAASLAYSGNVALMHMEDSRIGFYVPREGSAQTADDFVIPAGAGNPDLAHAFINHLLDIEMARLNMEGGMFRMFVPEAREIVDDSVKNNPGFTIPQDALDRCETIRDLGPDTEKYRRIWREFIE